MSVNENMINSSPPSEYTPEKGRFIAEQYSDGETFRNLASCFPKFLPSAMYIKAWRAEYPAFDQLMTMAERARADWLMEECLEISDDPERQAANAANAIKVRTAMAAALDSQVYGNKRIIAGDKDNPLLVGKAETLSDEQLMMIARGALIDGTGSETGGNGKLAPPAPPPEREGGPSYGEVRGPEIPPSKSEKHSVTTQKSKVIDVIFERAIKEREKGARESVIVKGIDPGF